VGTRTPLIAAVRSGDQLYCMLNSSCEREDERKAGKGREAARWNVKEGFPLMLSTIS